MHRLSLLIFVVGCATQASSPTDVGADPDEASSDGKADGAGGIPDVRCATPPVTAAAGDFRHTKSDLIAAFGDANHRGLDLVATSSATSQAIQVELSYGLTDKALEDEDVDLYACRAGRWKKLGTARSDGEGLATLTLTGSTRLPLGMRDMYASVIGDRSGVRFLSVVEPEGSPLVVSDIDGTLTSSENAFAVTVVLGVDISVHDGAPEAFRTLARKGFQPVYVTARARNTEQMTREWLDRVGMPRGPVRLSPHVILPGSATLAYKTKTLEAFEGFELALGNGNRASDVEAYTAAGLPADRITVKLPEFTDELADLISQHKAIGFQDYSELSAVIDTMSR